MMIERDSYAKVGQVLAAIGAATPPVGMEARIAERLQRHQRAGASQRLVEGLHATRGAWWRGALTGAAAALFVTSAVLFARGSLHTAIRVSGGDAAAGYIVRSSQAAVTPAPVAVSTPTPCSRPSIGVGGKIVPLPAHGSFRFAGLRFAPLVQSYPASEPPLTAEERQLVRLARRGYPPSEVTVDPAVIAHVEAQDSADFQRFFQQAPQGEKIWNSIVAASGDGI